MSVRTLIVRFMDRSIPVLQTSQGMFTTDEFLSKVLGVPSKTLKKMKDEAPELFPISSSPLAGEARMEIDTWDKSNGGLFTMGDLDHLTLYQLQEATTLAYNLDASKGSQFLDEYIRNLLMQYVPIEKFQQEISRLRKENNILRIEAQTAASHAGSRLNDQKKTKAFRNRGPQGN